MRPARDVVAPVVVGDVDEDARWSDLGVRSEAVDGWKANGFGPFEAALAQGDGFTPATVAPYRRQLCRIARAWVRQGLDASEGLRWHEAGFSAGDALRWRSQGIDLATARTLRDGYGRGTTRTALPDADTRQSDKETERTE
jgi:hypothetical protein